MEGVEGGIFCANRISKHSKDLRPKMTEITSKGGLQTFIRSEMEIDVQQ